MTPARDVFRIRDPYVTTTFRPTSASSDGTAEGFGESRACSPTMPGTDPRSCRDIFEESISAAGASASNADASSATATSLASSFSLSASAELSTTTAQRHTLTQKQVKQGAPTCRRRSSSNSSHVSFGTIEIHVVNPIPVNVPADSTNAEVSQTPTTSTISGDAKEEETSSSSSTAEEKAQHLSSPLDIHGSMKENPSLKASSKHVHPTSTQTSQENEDMSAAIKKATHQEDITTDDKQQPNDSPTPPKEEKSAAPKQEPIKCGLEIYERLRPPRRSRTELFLDAVRERSRRKLSHQPLSEEVIEAQKGLADEKNNSQAAAAAIVDGGSGHVDNDHCTLRRSDAVMWRSSNLSLEAKKNRRSKRLDELQGAAEGVIERSETGGLRSWSSNYGGGARL